MHKIIFTGPVGAGKTTAIGSISDVEPFATEEAATDDVKEMKSHTTVALDYGLLELGNGEVVHLCGTPGQTRFDFMWDILTEGGLGLVLLINNQEKDPIADLNFYLDQFDPFIQQTGVAIGINRMQVGESPDLDTYSAELRKRGLNAPIFEVDPRKPEDVILLTQALLFDLDPDVRDAAVA